MKNKTLIINDLHVTSECFSGQMGEHVLGEIGFSHARVIALIAFVRFRVSVSEQVVVHLHVGKNFVIICILLSMLPFTLTIGL